MTCAMCVQASRPVWVDASHVTALDGRYRLKLCFFQVCTGSAVHTIVLLNVCACE